MHLVTAVLLAGLVNGRQTGPLWTSLAPIPIAPRQEHTVVALSPTAVAILGGIIPNGEGSGYNTTDIMQLYNIPTNEWKHATPIPLSLNHPNAAAVDGKIYLLGGLVAASDGAWRAVPNTWVYDPESGAWTELDPMPAASARGSAAVGVFNKTIYLAGGMTVLVPGPGGEQGSVDTVLSFDTVSGKWTDLPTQAQKIPARRDHVGGVVVGSRFYVVGGRDSGQINVRDTVFALDMEHLDRGWLTREGRMPTPRGGIAAAAVGTKIYTFGGEGNPAVGSAGVFNETESYDTATDTWEKLAPMALPRHGTAAVVVDGKIFIPGGGIAQGAGPVSTLDVFHPY